MIFMVNNSPFGGREGQYVTSSKLRERVEKELRTNVSISVDWGDSPDRFTVAGRGELQLAILIEQMRREGYEFQVSMPQVITKTDGDSVLEPYETLVADMPKEHAGAVIRMLGEKKGVLEKIIDLKGTYSRLTFTVPMRGLFGFRMEFLSQTRGNGVMAHTYLGYREWAGKISGRRNGVLVSDRAGTVATYAVANIQDRGRLFVSAGDTVYAGQIVGETMQRRRRGGQSHQAEAPHQHEVLHVGYRRQDRRARHPGAGPDDGLHQRGRVAGGHADIAPHAQEGLGLQGKKARGHGPDIPCPARPVRGYLLSLVAGAGCAHEE